MAHGLPAELSAAILQYRLGSEVPAQRPLGPATLCASKTRKHKGKNTGEQDSKGVVDMEYTSLHGYIRNTVSDTAVHAEHQLTVDRST